MTIQLGDKAKDKITGLTGIVIAITKCLHGCNRIHIQPTELHEGKPQDGWVFDEPQVELIEGKSYKLPEMTRPGGPPTHIPTVKAKR